jgi:hypothetical protein
MRTMCLVDRSSPVLIRRSVPLNLEDLDIPDIDGDLKTYQTEAGATFSVRTVPHVQTCLLMLRVQLGPSLILNLPEYPLVKAFSPEFSVRPKEQASWLGLGCRHRADIQQ